MTEVSDYKGHVLETELGILLFKPSGLEATVCGYPLIQLVEGLLGSARLETLQKSQRQLRENGVRSIYPILDVPDLVYGEGWKQEVIEHMCSMPVVSLLLSGDQAVKKIKIIKDHVRSSLIPEGASYQSRIVRNYLHAVDDEDFAISLNVLFGAKK